MELVNMAKKEQDARLENNGILVKTQTDAIKEEISLKKRGQWFAVGSVCVIVGLCAYAFYLGHAAAAATIATGVIVGLAGVFIYSKYQEKKDPNS